MNLIPTLFLLIASLSDGSPNRLAPILGTTVALRTSEPALTVVNDEGKRITLSAEEFAKLPHQVVTAKDHSGANVTYSGVALAEVLRAAQVTLGKDLKGPRLTHCLLIQATDGYRVVFSLAEVDPSMSSQVILLADSKDSHPLSPKEGPYRLIVPSDKRFARWVRQVTEISVEKVTKGTPK
jgi:hypothetical protein